MILILSQLGPYNFLLKNKPEVKNNSEFSNRELKSETTFSIDD